MGQHSSGSGNKGFFSQGQGQQQEDLPSVDDQHVHSTAQGHHIDLSRHVDTSTDDAQTAQLKNHLGMPTRRMVEHAEQQEDHRDYSVKQLAEQQEYKIAAPSQPQINYMGIPHERLHRDVHTADPGNIDGVGQTWISCGNDAYDLQSDLVKAISVSESGWTGKSADKARDAVSRLARSSGKISQGSHLAGKTMTQQASALSTARATMPDPPDNPYNPVDAAAKLRSLVHDPDAYKAKMNEFAAQQEHEKTLHEQAARVAKNYDDTTSQLATEQPAFAPPPPQTKGKGGAGHSNIGFDNTKGGHGHVLPPQPGENTGSGDGTGYQYVGGDGDGNGRPLDAPPQQLGTTGTDTSGVGTQPYPGGTPLGGTPNTGGLNGPGGGYHGRSPVGTPIGGGLLGGGGPGSGGGSEQGGHLGSRRGGGGGAPGEGSGRTGAGEKAPGSGSRAGGRATAGGKGSAAAPEGETAAGKAASGRGTRGGRPMMGGRGKGGQGEDDYEHETPDFLEGPGDDFWSPQEKTAPPVIGDWWGLYDPTKPNSYNPDRYDG